MESEANGAPYGGAWSVANGEGESNRFANRAAEFNLRRDVHLFCAMKLALVRRGFSPTGGAEAYLRRFAEAAAASGHEPVLYTGARWPREAWPFAQERVPGERSPVRFARELGTIDFAQRGELLFSLERLFACDCYRAGDGVHAAWLRRRAACEPFWKGVIRRWQPKHRQILRLEEALLRERRARAVIVNSRMVGEEITRIYGYPAERLHLVYNGAPAPLATEEQRRRHAAVRRELGLADEAYVLLFAGSGWERKGLRPLLEAVTRARSRPVLLVAGSGRRRGLPTCERALYLGPVRGLADYLAAADAFVLPTLYDPFSNACLEAMRAGVPVITTRANGVAELLTAESGEALETPVDVAELAEAIDRWVPGRVDAERLRAAAAAFSVEANLAQTLRVLEAVGTRERPTN